MKYSLLSSLFKNQGSKLPYPMTRNIHVYWPLKTNKFTPRFSKYPESFICNFCADTHVGEEINLIKIMKERNLKFFRPFGL
jgi:hypothetical protein